MLSCNDVLNNTRIPVKKPRHKRGGFLPFEKLSTPTRDPQKPVLTLRQRMNKSYLCGRGDRPTFDKDLHR